jgi:myo-inositol 2-dehydrogenase / D-chiro-inositol 1-dehydrogenase
LIVTESASSRRDFLKASSLTMAGAAWAAGAGFARTAHAAGNDSIRVAVIGCGGRGAGAAANCLDADPSVKIVAMADTFQDRMDSALNMLRGKFGERVDVPAERQFTGLDAYQQALACDVQLVVLATPPGFRPAQYAAAIQAGKHVFMEKPLCVDAPGFRSLMATNPRADAKGLKVVVGLQRHHQSRYVEGMQRIHDGAIGEIDFLRVYWNGGPIWIKPRQPGWTEMEYQIRNWNVFRWLSGDHICEQHVHNIDVGLWALGGQHPIEAHGMGGREKRKGRDQGHIFDHHAVEFTFADGTKMFSQCRQMAGVMTNVSEAVHGTKGVWTSQDERDTGTNPYVQEHIDLIAAIRSGTKLNEGWHGATSSMTAVLGRMATYSGQLVKWDDAVEKGPRETPEVLAMNAPPPVLPDAAGLYDHAAPVPGVYQPFA